jgi:hypothetical protein
MKVTQYEVLGNDAKKVSVPPATIEPFWQMVPCMRLGEREQPSIVPSGTGRLLTPTQHSVLGYFHRVLPDEPQPTDVGGVPDPAHPT